MNDIPDNLKTNLSEGELRATLRDAVDFLPETYINENDKAQVRKYLESLFRCKEELQKIHDMKYEE